MTLVLSGLGTKNSEGFVMRAKRSNKLRSPLCLSKTMILASVLCVSEKHLSPLRIARDPGRRKREEGLSSLVPAAVTEHSGSVAGRLARAAAALAGRKPLLAL